MTIRSTPVGAASEDDRAAAPPMRPPTYVGGPDGATMRFGMTAPPLFARRPTGDACADGACRPLKDDGVAAQLYSGAVLITRRRRGRTASIPGIDDELGPPPLADVLKLPGRRDRLPHPPFAAATGREQNDVLHSPR